MAHLRSCRYCKILFEREGITVMLQNLAFRVVRKDKVLLVIHPFHVSEFGTEEKNQIRQLRDILYPQAMIDWQDKEHAICIIKPKQKKLWNAG